MSIGRILGFFAVLLTVFGSLHYYVWTRLVRGLISSISASA